MTRADYHPPFRTLPYPSTTSASILTPVKADDALAIEGLSVRDNWDSSDDELDVLGSVEGPGEGNAANANDAAVSGEVVDAARQDHEGGFSEVEEVSWRVEEASSAGMAAGSGEERRGGAMMPQRDARALEASTSTTTTADVFVEAGEGDKEENTNGEAATAVPEGKVEKLKGTNGATKGSAHPTAAGGGVGSAPERRSSKWGNSVIRGRLSRPSDGRVPTVEQEARERKERIEELRCVVSVLAKGSINSAEEEGISQCIGLGIVLVQFGKLFRPSPVQFISLLIVILLGSSILPVLGTVRQHAKVIYSLICSC